MGFHLVWEWKCDAGDDIVDHTETAVPPEGWLATTHNMVFCPDHDMKAVQKAIFDKAKEG